MRKNGLRRAAAFLMSAVMLLTTNGVSVLAEEIGEVTSEITEVSVDTEPEVQDTTADTVQKTEQGGESLPETAMPETEEKAQETESETEERNEADKPVKEIRKEITVVGMTTTRPKLKVLANGEPVNTTIDVFDQDMSSAGEDFASVMYYEYIFRDLPETDEEDLPIDYEIIMEGLEDYGIFHYDGNGFCVQDNEYENSDVTASESIYYYIQTGEMSGAYVDETDCGIELKTTLPENYLLSEYMSLVGWTDDQWHMPPTLLYETNGQPIGVKACLTTEDSSNVKVTYLDGGENEKPYARNGDTIKITENAEEEENEEAETDQYSFSVQINDNHLPETLSFSVYANGLPYSGSFNVNGIEYNTSEDGLVTIPVNFQKNITVILTEITEEGSEFEVDVLDQGNLHNQTAKIQDGNGEISPVYTFDAMFGSKVTGKQWNDNNSSTRIDADEFKSQFFLTFSTDGGQTYHILDENTMAELGLDEMPSYELNTSSYNTWTFTYDVLPLYTDVTQGEQVMYAAWESYEDEAYISELNGEETNDMAHDVVTNTKTTTYDADKVWADAGDRSIRPSVEQWKDGMVSLYRYTLNNQSQPENITAAYMDKLMVSDGGTKAHDEEVWHIHMDALPAFDASGYEYVYLLKEKDPEDITAYGYSGEDYYTAEYDNVDAYASRDTALYEGGELYNILTNQKAVNITKVWIDGNNENRPEAKLYLYRFALGVGDYDTASPVAGFDNMAVINDENGDDENPLLHTFGSESDPLPKYDATGHKYIYFASERYTGGDTTDYVKVIENTADASETTQINGWKNSYVVDGGTIKNIKKNDVQLDATKHFSAVFLQEILNNDTYVVFKLQRRSLNPDSEEQTYTDVCDEDGEIITLKIEDFRAEEINKTEAFEGEYALYDDEGYKYEYRYIETECQVGGIHVDVDESAYAEDPEGAYLVQHELLRGIQYTDGTSVYLDIYKNADGSITNALNGVMNVKASKVWNITDESGNTTHDPGEGVYVEIIVTQDGKPYKTVKLDSENNWEEVLRQLPRYDESGREYVYAAEEKIHDPAGYTYRQVLTYDVTYEEEELEGKEGLVKQINANFANSRGPGEPTLYLDLTKSWYDDSDEAHRYPVSAAIIDKETGETVTVLDYSMGKQTTAPVLSENNNWYTSVEWPASKKADGTYKTIDDYTVREIAVGDYPVSYSADPKSDPVDASSAVIGPDSVAAGTVTTDQYLYNVYINKQNYPDEFADIKADYHLSNQRVGELTLQMEKIWKDADLMQYLSEHPEITFSVSRHIADDDTVVEEVGVYKLDSGWTWEETYEKYDWMGRLYHYDITELEVGGNKVVDGKATVPVEIAETGETKDYVYAVSEEELDPVYGEELHTGDLYRWELKNALTGDSNSISLYKVWYDAGTSKYTSDVSTERPDISFNLYRTANLTPAEVEALTSIQVGSKGIELLQTDRIWNTVHNDWCWSCEVGNFPLYDEEGNLYTYFITENVLSNKDARYLTYYVNEEYGRPNTGAARHAYDVLDADTSILNRHVEVVLHGDEDYSRTTINRREGVRLVTGTKIWLNVPSSFTKNNLPDVKMELRRTTDKSLDWAQWEKVSEKIVSSKDEMTNFVFNDIYDLNKDGFTTDIVFDKYDRYGEMYTYEIKELSEIDGFVIHDDTNVELVVDNQYSGSDRVKVTVGKVWENALKEDKATSVYNLMRVLTDVNGDPMAGTDELAASVKKTETPVENYTVTFETDEAGQPLRYYAPNGRPYMYYVVEVVPYGYEGKADSGTAQGNGSNIVYTDYLTLTKVEGSEDVYEYHGGLTDPEFTNTYNGDKTQVIVTKNWDDMSDLYEERPENLVFILYRKIDGKKDEKFAGRYSVNDKWVKTGNRWTYTYSELEKYAENGHAYEYYVEEKDDDENTHSISGYKQPVKTNQSITNKLITKQIEVYKDWLTSGATSENLKQMSDEQLQILVDLGAFPAELTFKVQYNDGDDWKDLTDKNGIVEKTAALKMDSVAAVKAVLNGGPLVSFEVPAYAADSTSEFRQYRIIEAEPLSGAFVNDGEAVNVAEGTGKKSVRISNTIGMKGFRVDKIWKDNTNRDNTRPQDLSVTVTRNDGKTITLAHKSSVYPMPVATDAQKNELNALNSVGGTELEESNRYNIWSSGVIYLPAENDMTGSAASYTAAEIQPDGYSQIAALTEKAEGVDFWFVFANDIIEKERKVTNITAKKSFVGDGLITNLARPETIYLKLQVQTWDKSKKAYTGWIDAAAENCGLTGEAVHAVSADDQWETSWDSVWQYAEQETAEAKTIKYRVIETDKDGKALNDDSAFAYKINNGQSVNGNRSSVTDQADMTVTNTLKTTTTSVTKKFNAVDSTGASIDLSAAEIALMISKGVLPESLTFELYVSDDEGASWKKVTNDEGAVLQTVKAVTAASFANDTQSFTFTYPTASEQTLPAYDQDGHKLTYKMEEVGVRYQSDATDRLVKEGKADGADLHEVLLWTRGSAAGDSKITNSMSVGSVTVKKNWLDENNRDDKRALSVQLYRDGQAYGNSVTVTAADDWTYTWTNLPVYQNGSDTLKSNYYVVETAESSYVTVGYAVDGGQMSLTPSEVTVNADPANSIPAVKALNINITNKRVPERFTIEADKTWADALNVYGMRPEAITLTLQYYDDAAGSWKDVTGQVTLDENNLYTDGTTVYSTDAAAQTLTGGVNAEIWSKVTWHNLPVYYTVNGRKTQVKYRVIEADIPAYENTEKPDENITGTQGQIVETHFTNTLDRTETSFKKKFRTVNDQNQVQSADIVAFDAANPDDLPDQIVFGIFYKTEKSDWTRMTFDGAPDLTFDAANRSYISWQNNDLYVTITSDAARKALAAGINIHNLPANDGAGNVLNYKVEEIAVVYGSSRINVIDGKAGSMNAVYTEAEQNINEIFVGSIKVTKEWHDEENRDEVRSKKTFILYRDGDVYGDPVTISGDNNWTYTWTDLPVYQPGSVTKSTYKIVEDPDSLDGYTIESIVTSEGESDEAITLDESNAAAAKAYFEITNAKVPERFKIQASKSWDDNNNAYGSRPGDGKVTFTLQYHDGQSWVPVTKIDAAALTDDIYTDGETVYTTSDVAQTVTGLGTDLATWEKLPVNRIVNGKSEMVVYRVVETDVDGYSTTYNKASMTGEAGDTSVNVKNTLERKQLQITKTWSGDDEVSDYRPVSADYTIEYKHGSSPWKVYDHVTVNDTNWTAKVYDLPALDAAGHEYIYRVSEDAITYMVEGKTVKVDVKDGSFNHNEWTGRLGAYISSTVTEAGNVITVTSVNTLETTEHTASKQWMDNMDRDGLRREINTLSLQLYKDGTAFRSPVTITKDDAGNWSAASWKDLPRYTKDGSAEAAYTVKETTVPDKYRSSEADSKDASVITNTYRPTAVKIEASKEWQDAHDRYGLRPEEVTFTLTAKTTRDGENYTDAIINEASDTTYLDPDCTDGAGIYTTSSLTQTLKVDDQGNWTKARWENLPAYANGYLVKYAVSETPAGGYVAQSTETSGAHDQQITVTNTLDQPITLNVTKSWKYDDALDEKLKTAYTPDAIEFKLQYSVDGTDWQDVSSDGILTVTAKDHWTGSYSGLNAAYSYRAVETAMIYGETRVEKGQGNLIGNYICEMTTNETETGYETAVYNTMAVMKIDVTKTWDLKEKLEKGETTATLKVTGSDGSEYEHVFDLKDATETADEKTYTNDTYTFTLPVYTKTGESINYTVDESEISDVVVKPQDRIVYGETKYDKEGNPHEVILGRWDVMTTCTVTLGTQIKKDVYEYTNTWVPAADESVGEIAFEIDKIDANGTLIKDIDIAQFKNAVFKITDPEGKETLLQAKDGIVKVEGLTVEGQYTIEEISAPETYVRTPIVWTFNIERNMADLEYTSIEKEPEKIEKLINYYGIHITHAETSEPWFWEMNDKNEDGTLKLTDFRAVIPSGGGVRIAKMASDTELILTDAEFMIYPYDAASDTYKMDAPISMTCVGGTYYNDEELVADEQNLGRFKIVETKAPAGYAGTWEKEIKIGDHEGEKLDWNFTNTGEGAVYNEPNSFVLNKVDDTQKMLPGAAFMIWTGAEDPSKAADATEYITDEAGQIILTHLKNDTNYYYQEVKPADGYVLNDTVGSFSVDVHGQINGKAVYETEVVNTPNGFVLTKVDEDKKELKGVSFKIWSDADTADAREYVTDEKGQIVLDHLHNGTSYHYQEVKALDGYQKDDKIYDFVVDAKGQIEGKNIYEVTVINKKVKENADGGIGAKTGDHTNIMMLLMIMMIALAAIAVILRGFFKKEEQ